MNIATSGFGDEFQVPQFHVGDRVTVVESPFKGFDGTVVEVDQSLQLAVVSIQMYGKETNVPLRFHELATEIT